MYLPDGKGVREELLFQQKYPKMLNSSYNCVFLSSANWFGFLETDVNLSLYLFIFIFVVQKRNCDFTTQILFEVLGAINLNIPPPELGAIRSSKAVMIYQLLAIVCASYSYIGGTVPIFSQIFTDFISDTKTFLSLIYFNAA